MKHYVSMLQPKESAEPGQTVCKMQILGLTLLYLVRGHQDKKIAVQREQKK